MNSESFSAVVLAGGFSARMGCDKAELLLRGKSLIQHQVERFRTIGIEDIMVSGYSKSLPGTRPVPDLIPHRGPLSGLHAALLAAKNAAVIVLAVDTPLVPPELLTTLMKAHRSGVTLVTCGGKQEPLIGIYDSALASVCEALLQGENSSIRVLLCHAKVTCLEYEGDPFLLTNCNTPEDFARIQAYSKRKHILICGKRNSGKSELFDRLLRACRIPVYGFRTGIADTDADGRHYIHMLPVTESTAYPDDSNLVCICNMREREVRLDVFNTLGVKLLREAKPGGILVMDELGFIEQEAEDFCSEVLRALDGKIPILATVREGSLEVEFLTRVKSHPQAALYSVTPERVEDLYQELLPIVEEWNQVSIC